MPRSRHLQKDAFGRNEGGTLGSMGRRKIGVWGVGQRTWGCGSHYARPSLLCVTQGPEEGSEQKSNTVFLHVSQ